MERSNNIQSAAWNHKSLIAKTFDRNTLKMKAGCKSHWGDKQQKTIFPVVFRLDAQFGFARPFFTSPSNVQLKMLSRWDVLKTGPKLKCTTNWETSRVFFLHYFLKYAAQWTKCTFLGTWVKDLRYMQSHNLHILPQKIFGSNMSVVTCWMNEVIQHLLLLPFLMFWVTSHSPYLG